MSNTTVCTIESNSDVTGTGVSSFHPTRKLPILTRSQDQSINIRSVPLSVPLQSLNPSPHHRILRCRLFTLYRRRSPTPRSRVTLYSNLPDISHPTHSIPRNLRASPPLSSWIRIGRERKIRQKGTQSPSFPICLPSDCRGGFPRVRKFHLGDCAEIW